MRPVVVHAKGLRTYVCGFSHSGCVYVREVLSLWPCRGSTATHVTKFKDFSWKQTVACCGIWTQSCRGIRASRDAPPCHTYMADDPEPLARKGIPARLGAVGTRGRQNCRLKDPHYTPEPPIADTPKTKQARGASANSRILGYRQSLPKIDKPCLKMVHKLCLHFPAAACNFRS